jgi:hypothetical protein
MREVRDIALIWRQKHIGILSDRNVKSEFCPKGTAVCHYKNASGDLSVNKQHCVRIFDVLQRCDWRFRCSGIWYYASRCNRISAFWRNAIPSSSSVSKFPLNEHCRWSTFTQNIVIRLTHDSASCTRRRESSRPCSVLSILHNYKHRGFIF